MTARMWWVTGAAAFAVALAVVLAVALNPSASTHPRAVATSSPPPTIAAPTTPTPTPTLTPTPSSTRPPAPIQYVPAAAPTRFVMRGAPGHRFTITANVCRMPFVRPLDPPGEQHHTVCWVKKGFGVAPGSATATSYLLGHAWGQDDLEVMNPASERATKQIVAAVRAHRSTRLDGIQIYPTTVLDGATIELRTAAGRLTYTVRQVYGVAKNQAGAVRSLMNESTRNRIVMITCAESDHVDYDYDVIINAYLTSSARTPSTD